MTRKEILNTGSAVLGEVGEHKGSWSVQVTAYSGLTSIVPEVSVNGNNWVAASVRTPLAPATHVATITANGIYYFDVPGRVKARLTGTGSGSAVIEAEGSLD